MALANKNILVISPEPWDHIFVSKHHYAMQLAKRGNQVFFLNPPGKQARMASTKLHGVFEVDYKGFPKGLRFYPAIFQKRIISQVYIRVERLCSTKFDVVWSFDNSVFFDFSALPSPPLKISHIVDINQNFQTKKAAATADFCFCTTERIKISLSRYNRRVYKINHGYHVPPSGKPNEFPKGNQKIKVIYAGNLSIPYIDWSLLSEVIAAYPEVVFLFIGPNGNFFSEAGVMREAKKKVIANKNANFVGRVDFSELPQYYQSADILIVAYQEKYQDNQVANPHKMMEYLGSGKVIVATKTLEYLNNDPLIVMSNRNAEWPDLFRKVIGNLAYYNSLELQNQRKTYALENTYEQQISRVEQIININESRKTSRVC